MAKSERGSMTGLSEKISEISTSLVVGIITAIAGGIAWLVRVVFTNQKQIELLQKDLEYRQGERERDRSDIKEVRKDISDIKSMIMERKI